MPERSALLWVEALNGFAFFYSFPPFAFFIASLLFAIFAFFIDFFAFGRTCPWDKNKRRYDIIVAGGLVRGYTVMNVFMGNMFRARGVRIVRGRNMTARKSNKAIISCSEKSRLTRNTG